MENIQYKTELQLNQVNCNYYITFYRFQHFNSNTSKFSLLWHFNKNPHEEMHEIHTILTHIHSTPKLFQHRKSVIWEQIHLVLYTHVLLFQSAKLASASNLSKNTCSWIKIEFSIIARKIQCHQIHFSNESYRKSHKYKIGHIEQGPKINKAATIKDLLQKTLSPSNHYRKYSLQITSNNNLCPH